MKIFFDTEFTGLHKNTTLISIGMVAENGKEFYAELTDFDDFQCDEWIARNVLDNLILSNNKKLAKIKQNDNIVTVLGNKSDVANELSEWLSQFDEVQFVSDVCHYDMVLLVDLFGSAFELPKNVSVVCHDINQDVAKHFGISEKEAFDYSRESIMYDLCGETEIESGEKHNSLYDAKVIKAIYSVIK